MAGENTDPMINNTEANDAHKLARLSSQGIYSSCLFTQVFKERVNIN